MAYDPDKHHRRSIRLRGYDYTQPGAYFVTMCTDDRARILSQVTDGQVALTAIGRSVERCWLALPRHFPRVTLDAYVIMPDHMHGVVILSGEAPPVRSAPAGKACGTRPGSLAAIIQSFKSVSARRVNRMRRTPGAPLWQRDYYERIVRTEAVLAIIRRYIAQNPARWRGR